MDAAEADLDVKLQKISADLIADFDRSLPTFLRKPDGHGGSKIRSQVRASETWRLTNRLLDPFQELPQLLDPYLPKWVPLLSQAFLDHLLTRGHGKRASSRPGLLVSVDHAICRILYTLCKIRGEKVIVRFLNVETKYLEVLLSAVEEAEQAEQTPDAPVKWTWEQRYIVLLWLSHLLLAPFDLSTISSVDLDDIALPDIPGLTWPPSLPGITLRVVPLAISYLATPGRERDAAKALLVRTAMRRDMQQLGVLDSLVQWALASLRPNRDGTAHTSYFYLGILAFLAGVLQASSDTSDMDKYLASIFHTVHGISIGDSEVSKSIVAVAQARKLILKVLRTVVVSLLRQPRRDMASTELTETAIGYLLDSVGDNDTPVRLAASKSLSIITLKLDPEMASQVVEAVLESLNRNVLWSKTNIAGTKPVRDLSAVDNLEWHGLMLTLSHLLYRRSPPAEKLSDIVHSLLLGLSFEQRGTSGASVGANVRDAACFGIWALARRYTTQELLAVPTQSLLAARAHPASSSILQVLGTELVTTASLDPAGNIRRGASAALQELIGRHPDTVERGIEVVQTVDYHAVARRSRAIEEVAVNATRLSSRYGEAIAEGDLGWRGVGDMLAASRRVAGAAFGDLTAELANSEPGESMARFEASVQLITDRLRTLERRQVEERHGLLTCFASVLDKFPELAHKTRETGQLNGTVRLAMVSKILVTIRHILEECKATTFRRPEDIAEAASRLVVSSVPLLQEAALPNNTLLNLETGHQILSPSRPDGCLRLLSSLDSADTTPSEVSDFVSALSAVVPQWLARNEEEVIQQASLAALALLVFSPPDVRAKTLKEWASTVGQKPSSRASVHGNGYYSTLAMGQPLAASCFQTKDEDVVCKAILQRWQVDSEVETRVAILQSLTWSRLLNDKPTEFLGVLADGLNDYTTNARGDIGSHVRVQALRAVKVLWGRLRTSMDEGSWLEASVKKLFYSTLRLAAEKLDRVRPEAQAAVGLAMRESHANDFQWLPFSSQQYFQALLELLSSEHLDSRISQTVKLDAGAWMAELLAGFVTSADTGNEDLVIASRAALCEFCETSQEALELVCKALLHNLKTQQGQDRIVVPTLEVIAFLFHVGLFQRAADAIGLRGLCLQTQKAGYKTGNVRKIMACIKVYGAVARVQEATAQDGAAQEARKRLGALMFHPWPRVRGAVTDELWGVVGDDVGQGKLLMGVDWATAGKAQIRAAVEELGIAT